MSPQSAEGEAMALNLEEYFHRGMSYEEFVESTSVKQELQWFYDNTFLSEEQNDFLRGLERQINMLVVATDWCVDSQAHVPVMAKLADASPAIDLRIINRDEHEDFMRRYLTNGGMKIPLCLFLSPDFLEVERWVERPAEAYRLLHDLRAQGMEGDALYSQFKRRLRSPEIIEDAVAELVHKIERTELILLVSRRMAEQALRI